MARPMPSDFNMMRQDAIRRSREMQRRAVPPQTLPDTEDVPASIPPTSTSETVRSLPQELQGLFSGWDAERLALLALLYLLYKEGRDYRLLLALAYIIL